MGLAAGTAPQLARSQPSLLPPKVLGLTVREAKQRLHAAGWKFEGFSLQTPTPSYGFIMPIITDRPPDNWRVCHTLWLETSANIQLFLAPACVVRIPRLIGKTLRAAGKILHPLGLHIHDDTVDPRDRLRIDIDGDWMSASNSHGQGAVPRYARYGLSCA
jgi:hypothetical protein